MTSLRQTLGTLAGIVALAAGVGTAGLLANADTADGTDTTISQSQLQKSTGTYVTRAKNGESFTITQSGVPAARLVPPPAPPPPTTTTTTTTTASAVPPFPGGYRRANSYEASSDYVIGGGDNQWRNSTGYTLARSNAVGGAKGSQWAVRIQNNNSNSTPDGCGCPRMKFEDGHTYDVGDTVWFGGSVYLPSGEPIGEDWQNGETRLFNLQAWTSSGASTNNALCVCVTGNEQVETVDFQRGNPANRSVLMPARPIAHDRWVDIDVHAKLADTAGAGFTDTYFDGQLVAHSTARNKQAGSGPIIHYQGGAPYFSPFGHQGSFFYADAPRLAP